MAFFIFLASLVCPKTNAFKLSLIVFAITCSLELTQLIQTSFLNKLREYFVVHALIGSTFNWMDISIYIVGGGIGFLGLRWYEGAKERGFNKLTNQLTI